ncbi:GNAT family N-acetyltransferase [cf. Phormidesmis sp. LEGE 11477]|uniref:GNAT family N-acetyltransferase n=1 Tax=cf. Phormidesmis sp. LEGE 11477 TaxID=1828680 RepID=UPI001882579E|nr:GNAT family N-acetyltransferase [cf. Phormidesmis sp. LEGE 11477]MBE9061975.1 GNAT family N-acetyltransferase [cf. Phormidesmis sp. LEGE 11477]
MIRPIVPNDRDNLIALASAIALFEPDEVADIARMLSEHFSNSSKHRDMWFTDEENGELISIAYVAPERMTEGTWNLYLIAVHPRYQKQGRGAALLDYVKQTLVDLKARVLLVETLALDEFEYVRQFYQKSGFEEEARIREFYAAGADKVIFWQTLAQT